MDRWSGQLIVGGTLCVLTGVVMTTRVVESCDRARQFDNEKKQSTPNVGNKPSPKPLLPWVVIEKINSCLPSTVVICGCVMIGIGTFMK